MYLSLNLDSANIFVTVGFLVFGFLATYFFIEPYEHLTQNITSRKTRYIITSLILISIYTLIFSIFEFDFLRAQGLQDQSLFNAIYGSNIISYNMTIIIISFGIFITYVIGLIKNIKNNIRTNWYKYITVRKKHNKYERLYNRILLEVLNSTETYKDLRDKIIKKTKRFIYKTYVHFTSLLDSPLNFLSIIINTFFSKDLILLLPFLVPIIYQSGTIAYEYKDFYLIYLILFIVIFRYFYLLWKSRMDYVTKYELLDVFDNYVSFIQSDKYKETRLRHLANSEKHSIFCIMDSTLKKDEMIYYLMHRDNLSVEVVKSCNRWYYEEEENNRNIDQMNEKIEEWKNFFKATLKEIKGANENE